MTGGVPAGAEPPPMTRGRRSSFVGFAWVSIITGIVLLVVAVVADQDSSASLGTAIAGVALVGIGVLSIAGLLGPVTAAVFALAGGVLLGVVALSAADFGVAQAVLLGAAAAMFIGSFASLASSRQIAAGHGDEEPGAGVENV